MLFNFPKRSSPSIIHYRLIVQEKQINNVYARHTCFDHVTVFSGVEVAHVQTQILSKLPYHSKSLTYSYQVNNQYD